MDDRDEGEAFVEKLDFNNDNDKSSTNRPKFNPSKEKPSQYKKKAYQSKR